MKYLIYLLLLFSSIAFANCDVYLIEHIARNNAAIALNGGTVWMIYPKDRDKAWTWKVGDEVMMCYGHMINKVQEDREVSVKYIGNYCNMTGRQCGYQAFKCCGVTFMGA